MRRRLKKLAILMAATGLVASCILGFSFLVPVPLRPSKVTQENLDRVELGMTDDQVEAILGPPGYSHSGYYTVFEHGMMFRSYWLGDEGYIIIEVSPGDHRDIFAAPWKVCRKGFFPVPRMTYGKLWMAYLGIYL